MTGQTPSLRADLHFGAVFGLGAAALTWSVATSSAWAVPGVLGFVFLGSLAGLIRVRLPRLGTLAGSRAVALAALLLFGLGPSVLARVLADAVGALARTGRGRDPVEWLTALHRVASGALESLLAGATHLALGGLAPAAAGGGLGGPLVGFVLVSAAARRVLAAFRDPGAEDDHADESAWRTWLAGVASIALAAGPALCVVLLYEVPAWRPALLAAPLLAVAAHLSTRTVGRRRAAAGPPPAAGSVYRAIAHALARAFAAGDERLEGHAWRVRSLGLTLGERIGMGEEDRAALSVAALLHDLEREGFADRLLVPPAGVSRRVADPLRLHPDLGRQILDAIGFPDGVRPILTHLGERWDGRGGPAGLAGEAIPLGARILGVADAFDVLVTDQPYRRGLSAPLAVESLRHEAGKTYDPRVIDALADELRLGGATRLGFPARSARATAVERPGALAPGRLSEAGRELFTLYEIERAVGYRLDPAENLLLITRKLDELVPHECAVLWVFDDRGGTLDARHAFGRSAERLRGRTLAAGDGMSGRVALTRRAAAERAPHWPPERRWVEERGTHDPGLAWIASCVVAPLVVGERCLGALALYAARERVYTPDERRTVVAVAGHAARAICRADPSHPGYLESLTDPRTGLPNARYLEITAAHLTPMLSDHAHGFGLLAFRVRSFEEVCETLGILAAERLLGALARRFAASAAASEVPVRYGQDLFLVLCPGQDPRELVRRWDLLLRAAGTEEVAVAPNREWKPELLSAHAACPADGKDLEALLEVLHGRLAPAVDRGNLVLPFRAVGSAG